MFINLKKEKYSFRKHKIKSIQNQSYYDINTLPILNTEIQTRYTEYRDTMLSTKSKEYTYFTQL